MGSNDQMSDGASKARVAKRRTREPIKMWLADNGYHDVLALVMQVEGIHRERGVKTRRNYWDALAGTKSGEKISIAGVEFPILAVARARKGWPPVEGALTRSALEKPAKWDSGERWPKVKAEIRSAGKPAKG